MADQLNKAFLETLKAYSPDSQYEVRVHYIGQLAQPNPREYARMTRTYQQMRDEYELLHAGEFTDEDVMRLAIEFSKQRTLLPSFTLFPIYVMISIPIIFGLIMFLDRMKWIRI